MVACSFLAAGAVEALKQEYWAKCVWMDKKDTLAEAEAQRTPTTMVRRVTRVRLVAVLAARIRVRERFLMQAFQKAAQVAAPRPEVHPPRASLGMFGFMRLRA
jgi:hypothetical protein